MEPKQKNTALEGTKSFVRIQEKKLLYIKGCSCMALADLPSHSVERLYS